MEHLKKFYARLRDLFLSMTPGNRIIAVLLLAVLAVSLGYLIVGSVRPSEPASKYTFLYDGRHFTGEEKRAVENSLSGAGLKGHEWIGDQLRVPKAHAGTYAAQIALDKAIGDRGTSRLLDMAQNLGVFDGSKIMNTKMLEVKAVALADEISAFPEIASASVFHNHRVEWDKNVWARKTIPSVTVFVDTVHFRPLSDNTVSAIGQAVARAYGITGRNEIVKEISIVDRKNNRTYNGWGRDISGGGGDYFREQVKYQEFWKDKIYRILPDIPGLQVETTVILTKLINEHLFTVEHQKPKAIIHEHVLGREYLNEGAERYGRPGMEAQYSQTLIDPRAGIAERRRITDKKHEREVTNALQGTEREADVIPLIPERIFASLRVPREYVLATWRARNKTSEEPEPTPSPEQLTAEEETIRQDVRRSVGKLLEEYRDPKAPDPLEMVQVAFYDPLREPEAPALTSWQQFRHWVGGNWQNLSLMGLVLCGLCVLWAMTRPTKPDPIVIYEAPEIPVEMIEAQAREKAGEEATHTDETEEEINRTLEPFDRSMRSLQEEIADLVEENPNAAAAVLRQWIGNVVLAENK